MAEEQELDRELSDYKSNVTTQTGLRLDWEEDLIFKARTSRGEEIDFDAKVEWGCMPTEALLASLAGCLAIDVVAFLKKMRAEITSMSMEVQGDRNPTPPQYYKGVTINIKIAGENITSKMMDRVVSLSQEKYCSVRHTLRPDLDVKITYQINK